MLPMKEMGLMYSVMIHALRAFRAEADLLTNTMDVFVREPSFDWKVGFVLYVLSLLLVSQCVTWCLLLCGENASSHVH